MSSNPAFDPDEVSGEELPPSKPPPPKNGVNGQELPPSKSQPPKDEEAQNTLSEADELKEQKRQRKPLWYCKQITTWPKLSFFITFGLHMLMMMITAMLMQTGYDIIPITFDRLPLDLESDTDYLRDEAWFNRNENDAIIERFSGDENAPVQPERSQYGDGFVMLFEIEGGNVFTEARLKEMEEMEEKFWGMKEFQEKYCMLANKKCMKPRSILRYFDGTFSWADPVLFRDYTGDGEAKFHNYIAVLNQANSLDATKQSFEWFLGKTAAITSTSAMSEITRSSFLYGLPLNGYANVTHKEDEQIEKLEKFLLNTVEPEGAKVFKDGAGDMDFVYFSGRLIGLGISKQVIKDMALAIGSFAFIIVFMAMQTGSLFITGFTILSIITGFCAANLLYRVVFDFIYFGIFHVLAIFIILGIGADDVFVFMDTWKESSHHRYLTLAHRMSDTYRKAALAMLFTSITTAMAFVVSATSPFLGINSFGVFAAILVCVNYLSVILFLPCVVTVHHLYFAKYKCCCCCPRVMPSDSNEPDVTFAQEPKAAKRKNAIVRFFRGPYFRFITHKIARWVIVAVFVVIIGIFIYFSTQLKVNEEQVKFLPDDSNFGRYLVKSNDAFKGSGDFPSQVKVIWGLEEQDKSNCHKTNVSCTGKTVWDDNFNLNSAKAQQALKEFCEEIRDLSDEKLEELAIQKNLVTEIPEVECFIEDMETFYANQVLYPKYPIGTDLDLPWGQSEAKTIIDNTPMVYSWSKLNKNAGFSRYFEVALSFWLYNGFNPTKNADRQMNEYNDQLGEAMDPPYTVTETLPIPGQSMEYFYGTRLRYAAITVNLTINGATLGFPKGIPIRDAWEDFVTKKMNEMPDGVNGGFQITEGLWHWLKVQESLSSSAVVGVVIGLCLAFPILVIATSNIIVGLMATVTIVIITISVIGVIPMAGWKLGVLESLNLVLVVGLAVDYVVHLAEGYSRSTHNDRLNRLQDTLDEVGISVLSGACTTLGASLFLLLAHILFFTQFGIFMFSTIGFSILYALGFFTTMLGILGPQNEFGSLKPLYRACARKCCKGKEE